MPAHASPSGFATPYHFSISPTCGLAGTCFYVEYTPHPALKGLKKFWPRVKMVQIGLMDNF